LCRHVPETEQTPTSAIDEESWRAIDEYDGGTDPRATYGDLLACQAWQREDDLSRIDVPTLVIHGDAESPEVTAQANKLLDRLPNASKVVVGQAGRMILYEQPETLASEIGTFLGGLS
jgi:pimeloyl-ACP methyl ester carboxylesterase